MNPFVFFIILSSVLLGGCSKNEMEDSTEQTTEQQSKKDSTEETCSVAPVYPENGHQIHFVPSLTVNKPGPVGEMYVVNKLAEPMAFWLNEPHTKGKMAAFFVEPNSEAYIVLPVGQYAPSVGVGKLWCDFTYGFKDQKSANYNSLTIREDRALQIAFIPHISKVGFRPIVSYGDPEYKTPSPAINKKVPAQPSKVEIKNISPTENKNKAASNANQQDLSKVVKDEPPKKVVLDKNGNAAINEHFLTLKPNRFGKYEVNGKINEISVNFWLDPGASISLVPSTIAGKLGWPINCQDTDKRPYTTVQGSVFGCEATASVVGIGKFEFHGHKLAIVPIKVGYATIGMDLLAQMEIAIADDGTMLLYFHGQCPECN